MPDTQERLDRLDNEIDRLKKRMERAEGELGIVDVDPAGIPNEGERRPQQRPPQQEN